MEHIGACELRKTFTCALHAGSNYNISHSQLHRATNNCELLTSTIMIQQTAIKSTTRVMTDTILEHPERVDSPHFSVSELKSRIERYIRKVKGYETTT